MRQPDADRRVAGPIAGLLLAGLLSLPGAAAADGRVTLNVVTRAGGPAVTDGVAFQIWARDGKRAVRKVGEHRGAPAELDLAADEYRVVTTYRQARAVTDFAVQDGTALTKTVNLKLGRVKLELLPGPGAAPVQSDVAWTVRPYRRGGGEADPIARTRDAAPELGLSAGWYKVAARHRDGISTHLVEVAAGRRVTYSLFLK
ncbi:hypothetical protein CKO28_11720 [Rhodovibrio sodomensis]|uniref:Carboxypeptidase regulatory-like domain-containing protein n=1 Tax=Rhodovibrio sodomensis TaxID=1088 RepID=A0ABS1DFD7_9PROT|nr:hypothetical protein [Rhodovibrio sodomensis]MBK1668696.1 hypothetical protein [Rhodovibrio sodomensis]